MKKIFVSVAVIGVCLSNVALGMEPEPTVQGTTKRRTVPLQIRKDIFGTEEKEQECVNIIKKFNHDQKTQWDMVKYYMNSDHLGKMSCHIQMAVELKKIKNPSTGEEIPVFWNPTKVTLISLYTPELKSHDQYMNAFHEISESKKKIEEGEYLYDRLSTKEREEQVFNLQKLAAYFCIKMDEK
jgi:hypothetical protein